MIEPPKNRQKEANYIHSAIISFVMSSERETSERNIRDPSSLCSIKMTGSRFYLAYIELRLINTKKEKC